MLAQKSVLLLIDMQKGLDQHAYYGGNRNNPEAEKQASKILRIWRAQNLPLIHIRHCSQHSDSPLHSSNPGFAFKDEVAPLSDETVLTKNVNSAFIGTDLHERLTSESIKTLVMVGLTTNHCVSTTARMAGNLGYEVILIEDAMATFDRIGVHGEHYPAETIHLTSLASLNEEFAEVITANQILARLQG